MSERIKIGDLYISDSLDSMFSNLKPVPRIEINEESILFIDYNEIKRYTTLKDALIENQTYSGFINFNSNLLQTISEPIVLNNRNLIFNMNEFSLSIDGDSTSMFNIQNNSEIIFYHGTINSNISFVNIIDSNVIFENIELNANKDINIVGNIQITDNSRIKFIGEETTSGFSITGSSSSLRLSKQSIIESENGACITNSGSHLILDSGKIYGNSGIVMTGGTLDIPVDSDIVIIGGGYSLYDNGTDGSLGTTNLWELGNALVVEKLSDINMDIYAGKFIGLRNVPVGSYAQDGSERLTKFLNGGTLDRFPSTTPYEYDSTVRSVVNVDYDILADGCYGTNPCYIMRGV